MGRRGILATRTLAGVVGMIAMPAVVAAGPSIDHAPVGCVEAERFPQLEARFDPAAAVARGAASFSR